MTLPLGDRGRPGGGGIDLPLGDSGRSAGAPSGGAGRRASVGAATCSGGRPPAVGRPLEITRDDASAGSATDSATTAGACGSDACGDCSECAAGSVCADVLTGAGVSAADVVSIGATESAMGAGAGESTRGATSAVDPTGASATRCVALGVSAAGVSATGVAATGVSATAVSMRGVWTTAVSGAVARGGAVSVGTSADASTAGTEAFAAAAASSAVGASPSIDLPTCPASASGAAAFFAVFGFASDPSAATFFAAACFLAGAFLPGLTSSGCTSRFNPSRSARRVTMSAYASASEDDGPLAATPSTPHRSRTSTFVIPSSFASSWILIFFAATLSIQPFTVVFASRMLESMRIRMFVTIGPTADSFSDRVFVVDADVVLPRSGERPT